MLQQCLEHLATFRDTNFELIIGDNASDDNTTELVESMRYRFPYLIYLRHRQNVGFARNMDSILRQACRKFVYILNDDDIVFEDALSLVLRLMNSNDGIVATVGQYLSLRKLDSSIQIDYSNAIATTIGKAQFPTLLDHLHLCDGHPVIRREIFDKHCAYLDRTGTLIPLYFGLLQQGNIVSINKPLFQHRTTGDSLTGRMAEAWFLDMANADIELAVSSCAEMLPIDAMANARQRLLKLIYLQAARMSVHRKAPYLLWLFLRRLVAVGGATEDLLIQCEYHFSHDMVIDRIARVLGDSEIGQAYFLPSTTTQAVIAELSEQLPKFDFIECDSEPMSDERKFLICEDGALSGSYSPHIHLLALKDIFDQVRLTNRPCQLALLGKRVAVQYLEQEAIDQLLAPSRAFQILCSPYSEEFQ